MKLKGAIFDLDGVIVNTVPLHFKAWKRLFEEYGHKFEMKDYLAKVDGRPRLEGAAAILTEFNEEEIKEAGAEKQFYFLECLEKDPIEIFESSVKLLNEMKKKGIKLAAASSSKNATKILKRINLFNIFDVNVSGADFEKGKPDPEIFLLAASKMNLKPEECVVFEDAKSGVEAARRGNFFCVGIDRHGNPEALKDAHKIVKDLSEIVLQEIIDMIEGSR